MAMARFLRQLPSFPNPTTTRHLSTILRTSDISEKGRMYGLSLYRSLQPMRSTPRRRAKRLHLPTHYVEVSYKLRKAVVFYHPSIAHIPHGVKNPNPVLIPTAANRGQNT